MAIYDHFSLATDSQKLPEETFWIVRKIGLESQIESHNTNPVKTSYEMLWEEVRKTPIDGHTIQNTLRRILEYYFTILGGIDRDEICNQFEGEERSICNALFSWINDGSHFAYDDLFIALDSEDVDSYLAVFRKIFEKTDHLAHYKMMMRKPVAAIPLPV